MNEARMTLGLNLLDAVFKYGLPAVSKLIEIAHAPEPTKEDWIKLLTSISSESYDDYLAAARARASALGTQTSAPTP